MKTADIAIFLISKNSLTSDFILRKEMPILLTRKKNEGMPIIPVLVGYCLWEKIKWLAKMQVRPEEGIPISEGEENERDKRCVEVLEEVTFILEERSLLM